MKRKLFFLNFLTFLCIANLVIAQQSEIQQPSLTNNSIAKTNVPDTGCTGQDTFDQGVRIVSNANS